MKWFPTLALLVALPAVNFAQKLEVKSATSTKVALAWSDSGQSWIVERKSGSAFQKIGETATPTYEDSKIAPFATYTYRVRAGATAAPSNSVTVGPPPMGVLKAAPAPTDSHRDSDDYGRRSALALDENGDAAFAFLWRDPNANNRREESAVMFVRWNRALCKWEAPTKIAVTGVPESGTGEPISMAFESGTGIAGLIFPVKGQNGFTFALSRDGGATWQMTPYTNNLRDEISSSTLIFSKEHFYLAVNVYGDGPELVDGDIGSDSATWRMRQPPVVGREHQAQAPVSLAMDGQGNLFMAFYDNNVRGQDGYLFNVWQPDSGKTVTVSDTHGDRPDSPNLKLAAGSGKLVMLMAMNLDENDHKAGIWSSASTNGVTWTPAAKVPHDANRSNGDSMSVAVDSKGAIFSGYSSPSGGLDDICGNADYATSSDGVNWKYCSGGKPAADTFTPNSETRNVVIAPDNSVYYLWNEGRSKKFGAGLLVWHRP